MNVKSRVMYIQNYRILRDIQIDIMHIKRELQSRGIYTADDKNNNEKGRWITLEGGSKAFIGEGGKIEKGAEELQGKTLSEISSSGSTSTGAKKTYKKPVFNKVESETDFKQSLTKARDSNKPEDKWRVDEGANTDYNNAKMYTTNGGSTYALQPDGNIVSVCKMQGSDERGSDILQHAINNGGTKLDAFGKRLFGFYTGNGFEPVSWTKFNEEYAPNGWLKGRDEPEPILFYKYVGKGKTTGVKYDDFIKNNKPLEYEEAERYRDNDMKGGK